MAEARTRLRERLGQEELQRLEGLGASPDDEHAIDLARQSAHR
jgi:hypothetical protein